MANLSAKNIKVSYENNEIISDLSIQIPESKFTSIIGANGCGKSTLLKTLSRILKPKSGLIYLDGKDINSVATLTIAKKMAILPQSPVAPSGLTVEELVAYGRYPHQGSFGKLNNDDKNHIQKSLEITGMIEFKDRNIDELSGGQRQRAWIAMALAQDTDIILLDEPTTYLDLVHQLEVLKLLQKLNLEDNKTIVLVIHEINMAARFSDHMITLKNGNIVAQGTAEQIMSHSVLKEVFNIDAYIMTDPNTGKPLCITYDTFK